MRHEIKSDRKWRQSGDISSTQSLNSFEFQYLDRVKYSLISTHWRTEASNGDCEFVSKLVRLQAKEKLIRDLLFVEFYCLFSCSTTNIGQRSETQKYLLFIEQTEYWIYEAWNTTDDDDVLSSNDT